MTLKKQKYIEIMITYEETIKNSSLWLDGNINF